MVRKELLEWLKEVVDRSVFLHFTPELQEEVAERNKQAYNQIVALIKKSEATED